MSHRESNSTPAVETTERQNADTNHPEMNKETLKPETLENGQELDNTVEKVKKKKLVLKKKKA